MHRAAEAMLAPSTDISLLHGSSYAAHPFPPLAPARCWSLQSTSLGSSSRPAMQAHALPRRNLSNFAPPRHHPLSLLEALCPNVFHPQPNQSHGHTECRPMFSAPSFPAPLWRRLVRLLPVDMLRSSELFHQSAGPLLAAGHTAAIVSRITSRIAQSLFLCDPKSSASGVR